MAPVFYTDRIENNYNNYNVWMVIGALGKK